MTNKVYLNDTGTLILLDTGVDLSSGTTLAIQFRTPAGITGTWPGTLANAASGANHGISYVTQADDLAPAGIWKLQAHAVLSSGTWSGETVEMVVHQPFE
jgi:hypothetical protein